MDLLSGLGVGVILVQGPNLQARRDQVSLAFLRKVPIMHLSEFSHRKGGMGRRDDTGVFDSFFLNFESLFPHWGPKFGSKILKADI